MRPPARVADRHDFDTIIDARSPAEFAIDHIPGAINCPVLDDAQRHTVGTMYVQQSAFEARRVGGAMVAENIARHLRERFADMPPKWKPLVYCWRGGMRSGSMVTVLRMVGWDVQQLAGGYKAWRRHVIDQLEDLCPRLPLHVLVGATGSAKTRVLRAMAEGGHQVLDLEALAVHKGSILGNVPGAPQPSQTAFETQLADAIERFDLSRPVFVEGESRKIGKLTVPLPLVQRMRASPCIEIGATIDARLAYLLRDYAYLGADSQARQALAAQFGLLKELHGKQVIERWQAWAEAGELAPLSGELMALHYDPLYARSQSTHFQRWAQRETIACDDLSPQGIRALAHAVAQRAALQLV